ncbi:hypothetical protein MZG96_24875, partial [Escherichia coli]|nr:hypothetical protein [Escherichia coli]
MRRKRLIRPTFGTVFRPDKTRISRLRHVAQYCRMRRKCLIRPTFGIVLIKNVALYSVGLIIA